MSGIGFDVSHSLTDLNRSYFSKDACIESAKTLNMKPNRDKQIGLDNGVAIRYVCILKPKIGQGPTGLMGPVGPFGPIFQDFQWNFRSGMVGNASGDLYGSFWTDFHGTRTYESPN